MARKLHSAEARRFVRMAQIAGVALGASAAAVVALDVPGLRFVEPSKPEIMPAAKPVTNGRLESSLDKQRAGDAGERLDMAVSRPVVAKKEEAPKAPEPVKQQSSGPVIAYIGPIYEATRTLAVVSIDGRQKIVSEGRTVVDNLRLDSVGDQQIVLKTDSGDRTIARGERTGSAVSWVRNMPNSAPVAAASQNAAQAQNAMAARRAAATQGRTTRGGLTPEMEQRFRERGVPPEQLQRWREAARQRETAQQQQGLGIQTVTADAASRGVVMADEDARQFEGEIVEAYTTTEEGMTVITRLRRMHESGELGEDEYIERVRRLQEDGTLSDDLEIDP